MGGGGGGGIKTIAATAIALHLLSSTTLLCAYFIVSQYVYGFDLVTHPTQTLRILLIVEAPVVIGSHSWVRRNPKDCSVMHDTRLLKFLVEFGFLGFCLNVGFFALLQLLKAAGRGLLSLPIGALLNAFGAIVLGAPIGIKYLARTAYWSLLMSLFTFVPAACVFGSSRIDWQHFVACDKPTEITDYMIYFPAYGAVVGAWVGAWPMPLDWERPWQEWPICVTYGSVAGYLVGLLASSVCILLYVKRPTHTKSD